MRIILLIPFLFFCGLTQAKWNKEQATSEESDEDTDFPLPPRITKENSGPLRRVWWSSGKTEETESGQRGSWWGASESNQEGAWWDNRRVSGWWGTENSPKTWWSVPTRDSYDVCRVSNNKVETITNVRYSYPSTTCYTILARECSSVPNFLILLRQLRQNSNLWELKVDTQYNSVVLRNTNEYETVQLHVNGDHYKSDEILEITENGQVVSQLVKNRDFNIIHLPTFGVQLGFDGFNVVIRVDKSSTNQLCGGVCDHRVTENTDPLSGSIESDINEEIHKNYILKNECLTDE